MANGLEYTRLVTTPEAMKQLAATLAPYLHPCDVVVLTGDLGAGKTQFVQGIAAALGVTEGIVSPTFNIVLEHAGGRLPLYHFDLYRLDESESLEDIGFYDIVESDGVSFIEWGDRFADQLPYDYLYLSITVDEEGIRRVRAHSCGDRSRQLLCVWGNDSKSRLAKSSGSRI